MNVDFSPPIWYTDNTGKHGASVQVSRPLSCAPHHTITRRRTMYMHDPLPPHAGTAIVSPSRSFSEEYSPSAPVREEELPSPSLPGDRSPSAPVREEKLSLPSAHLLEEGLPAEEVHRRAVLARKHLAHAQRALSFYLVDMEKRMLYRHFGCSSVFQYGELYLELAPHTIAEYLRSGKEMAKLPLLAAACEQGEISPSKIREISRVAVPETEEAWLSLARNSTYRQIEKLVPLTPRGGLPPAAAMNPPALAGRSHGSAPGVNGSQVVYPCGQGAYAHSREENICGQEECACGQAEYPEPGGDSIQAADTGNPHDLPLTGRLDEGGGEGVGPRQYRTKFVLELEHDRLALITRALAKARKESGERERGALLAYIARAFLEKSPAERTCTERRHAERGDSAPCRVTIHHLGESGISWTETGGGPGSLSASGLQYVPASTLEESLCDAEILDLGEPGDPGASDPAAGSGRDRERHGPRMRRTIPLTLRRKVLERDEHRCTVPGCGHGSYLALHHIVPVASGGKDRAGALTTVCFRCHRALHACMLFVEGEAPGALVWKNRHGAVLKGGRHGKG